MAGRGGWKEGEAPRLLLSSSVSGDHDDLTLCLEARVVKVYEDGGAVRVRNILSSEPFYGMRLADLNLRCYVSDNVAGGQPYGMGIEYKNVHSIEYEDARGMAETFKKIRRHMDRVTEEVGPPESVEGFFTRVLLAIGSPGALRQVGTSAGWNYDSGQYVTMNGEDMRFYVRELVRKFKEKEKTK